MLENVTVAVELPKVLRLDQTWEHQTKPPLSRFE